MRVLIYSDVHGNLPAFKAVIKDAGKCDSYISLGDLVGYGPWGNECIDLAISLPNSILVMGNHEEMFIEGQYSIKSSLVNKFFEKTFPLFSRMDIISKSILSYKLNNFTLTHTVDNKYVYSDSNILLDKNYIIGHSHHQFRIDNSSFVLYNAGSVGQNRKYINMANYLIFDTHANTIEMKYTLYNIKVVIDKMKKLQYPNECVEYYTNKEIYA